MSEDSWPCVELKIDTDSVEYGYEALSGAFFDGSPSFYLDEIEEPEST